MIPCTVVRLLPARLWSRITCLLITSAVLLAILAAVYLVTREVSAVPPFSRKRVHSLIYSVNQLFLCTGHTLDGRSAQDGERDDGAGVAFVRQVCGSLLLHAITGVQLRLSSQRGCTGGKVQELCLLVCLGPALEARQPVRGKQETGVASRSICLAYELRFAKSATEHTQRSQQ